MLHIVAIASTQNKLCCRIDALHPTPRVYLFAMSAALDLDKCFALVSFSACGQQKVQVRMREAKTPQRNVAGLELHPGGLVENEVSVIVIAMQGINRVSER